jgi:hypothetical protein
LRNIYIIHVAPSYTISQIRHPPLLQWGPGSLTIRHVYNTPLPSPPKKKCTSPSTPELNGSLSTMILVIFCDNNARNVESVSLLAIGVAHGIIRATRNRASSWFSVLFWDLRDRGCMSVRGKQSMSVRVGDVGKGNGSITSQDHRLYDQKHMHYHMTTLSVLAHRELQFVLLSLSADSL